MSIPGVALGTPAYGDACALWEGRSSKLLPTRGYHAESHPFQASIPPCPSLGPAWLTSCHLGPVSSGSVPLAQSCLASCLPSPRPSPVLPTVLSLKNPLFSESSPQFALLSSPKSSQRVLPAILPAVLPSVLPAAPRPVQFPHYPELDSQPPHMPIPAGPLTIMTPKPPWPFGYRWSREGRVPEQGMLTPAGS